MIYRLYHYAIIKLYKNKPVRVMFHNVLNLPYLNNCLPVNIKNR